MKTRIQKLIAQEGIYSRRAVEKLIDERKVKVNGIIVSTQGRMIDPLKDRIQIDGKAFHHTPRPELVAILLNKPRHVMVTRSDPEGRTTVYDVLPKEYAHLKPVGRLDFNTQGALILTNDGDLILKLTHPRYEQQKIYEVKLSSHPDEKQINRLRHGVILDGVRTLPAQIDVLDSNQSTCVLRFVLREGKNRQIRRMCEVVGLTVKELKRVAIGPIQIKRLRSGQFRALTEKELVSLFKQNSSNSKR